MLKGIGFIILGLGSLLMIPQTIKKYKEEKTIESLLDLIALILLVPSSLILGISEFI